MKLCPVTCRLLSHGVRFAHFAAMFHRMGAHGAAARCTNAAAQALFAGVIHQKIHHRPPAR